MLLEEEDPDEESGEDHEALAKASLRARAAARALSNYSACSELPLQSQGAIVCVFPELMAIDAFAPKTFEREYFLQRHTMVLASSGP